jgi:predicted nuclease with TOPRIM domain
MFKLIYMNTETFELQSHIKKATQYTNYISGIVAVVCAMSVGYGFYYNTAETLDEHTKDIKEVKQDVNTIKNDIQAVDVFKGVSQFEVKTLEEKIMKLEGDVSKMDDKLDQILLQTRR